MKETNRIGCYISNLGVSNHGRSRQDHVTNDKRELCKPGNETRGGEPRQSESMKKPTELDVIFLTWVFPTTGVKDKTT
jgi:hypothetical protein